MQRIKGNVLFGLIAVFAVSVSIPSLHAQATGVAVDVPFDFSVGSQHLKAGSYRIQAIGSQRDFVALYELGGRTTYSLIIQRGPADDRNTEPHLVFDRSGDESFLAKIVVSEHESYDLPLTSEQKEIMARATSASQTTVPAGGSR